MISKEDVQHIAKLARLGLSQSEVKKFQEELSSILNYVEKLKKIDVANVEPTSHPQQIKNVMRKDEVKDEKLQVRRKLVEMAPDKKDGYIKVKSILK